MLNAPTYFHILYLTNNLPISRNSFAPNFGGGITRVVLQWGPRPKKFQNAAISLVERKIRIQGIYTGPHAQGMQNEVILVWYY